MLENYIQVVDCLTPVEARQAVILAEGDKYKDRWEQATVFNQNGRGHQALGTRTCERICVDSDFAMQAKVYDRLNKAIEKYTDQLLESIPKEQLRMPMPVSPNSVSSFEPVGLLRYTEGQYYDWHADANPHKESDSFQRTMSVVLYLNDDFEGGGTEFVDKVRKPKPGQALIFPSNWCFFHSAQPVTKGTKYAMVTWYSIWDPNVTGYGF